MQKLFIVCGLPGSGKTTFANALSKDLNIVCLHKDTFKENLYEFLDKSTLEDSKEIGHISIKLLYKIAEEQLAKGLDLIIEAPFYFEKDYALFRKWQKKYNLTIFSMVCSVEEKERLKRFKSRERHHSHHDAKRIDGLRMSEEVYNMLPGEIMRIETNRPVKELVKFCKKFYTGNSGKTDGRNS